MGVVCVNVYASQDMRMSVCVSNEWMCSVLVGINVYGECGSAVGDYECCVQGRAVAIWGAVALCRPRPGGAGGQCEQCSQSSTWFGTCGWEVWGVFCFPALGHVPLFLLLMRCPTLHPPPSS